MKLEYLNQIKRILAAAFILALISMQFGIKPVVGNMKQNEQNQQLLTNANACLTEIPQIASANTKFPDMLLNFRFIDSKLDPISGVLNTDIQIQENNSTPIYAKSITNGPSIGADYYFLIDSSNRTNPLVIKSVLESFQEIMLDGKDNITIINNLDSSYSYIARNISSKEKFFEAIQDLPDTKNPDFYTLYAALKQTIKEVDQNSVSCARPLFVVIIAGDVTFENPSMRGFDYSSEINKTLAEIVFIHYGSTTNYQYKSFAENFRGQYIDVASVDQMSEVARLITKIRTFQTTYDVVYRTNNGGSGNHNVAITYKGQPVNIVGNSQYTIQLNQPLITLTSQDNNILRVASKNTEEGYIFDKETQIIDFSVNWQGYQRDIKFARLIVNNGNPVDVKVEKVDENNFRFSWDMSGFDQRGTFPVKLELLVEDELSEGLSDRVFSGETSVQIINRVPASLMTTWLLYGLYILFGLLVISFLIWRKKITASIVKGGKSVGDVIRKTIVGNRNSRKNPIATLEILDGPQNLLGKELNIFADSVNLGRDPSRSDLTFYGPESSTSVSGLHCKLQRNENGWQISALSSSKSETFIEEESIPFLTPVSIADGQKIRLGYLAQQPVEFIFHIKAIQTGSASDPRKTKTMGDEGAGLKKQAIVPDETLLQALQKNTQLKNEEIVKPPAFAPKNDSPSKKEGSMFDEFR